MLELESVELDELLGAELLLENSELLLDDRDDVLLSELALLNELEDGNELLDLSEDELLDGGMYRLLELR